MRKKEDAPAFVDRLIANALQLHASDIHLDPKYHSLSVRFRVDGILYEHDSIETPLSQQVIACLKVRAHINITEKRIPQDGTFSITNDDQDINFRISSFPSLYGEKLVIRILNRSDHAISLDMLGFDQEILRQFTDVINQSQGFVLVVGPTGSGKTTTLYSALSTRNTPAVNIITLEDPIEYHLDGVTQGQVRPAAGFTFAKGIRALLRQDPDIVMVGEIRDAETAQIAIQAALTGHLVFSTVHTNDSSSVIIRLMDMGIPSFLLNASISGILAQRLARRICLQCRIGVIPTQEERVLLDQLGGSSVKLLYRGNGCSVCRYHGYKGRVGLFELLIITDTLRALISSDPRIGDIVAQATADGMQSLCTDGLKKVKAGIISLKELVRILS